MGSSSGGSGRGDEGGSDCLTDQEDVGSFLLKPAIPEGSAHAHCSPWPSLSIVILSTLDRGAAVARSATASLPGANKPKKGGRE